MAKKWRVEIIEEAAIDLNKEFKNGFLISEDIQILKRWIKDVEEDGLLRAQSKPDWRDHELFDEWKGHRAISFSFRGRVIYRVEKRKVVVKVVRITHAHDYRQN